VRRARRELAREPAAVHRKRCPGQVVRGRARQENRKPRDLFDCRKPFRGVLFGVVRQSLVVSLVLIAITLVPAPNGKMGLVYFAGALMLGTIFACCSARLALQRSNASARRLLVASIVYLPAIFILLMLAAK
jgi:hypothetical protein